MSETPGEYVVVGPPRHIPIFTRYFVIADGKVLFEGDDESKAYRWFMDHRYTPGVRDFSLVIKHREMPASGLYKDVVW